MLLAAIIEERVSSTGHAAGTQRPKFPFVQAVTAVLKKLLHPYGRVFTASDLSSARVGATIAWSVLATVLLCLLLFDCFLIADLLENRGTLEGLNSEQSQAVARMIGGSASPQDADAQWIWPSSYIDQGILPAVWWSRDHWWSGMFASLYRNVTALQFNDSALLLLVASAILLGVLRILALSRARRLSMQVSFEVVTRLRRNLHRQALRLGVSDLEETESRLAFELFTDETECVRQAVARWIYRMARYPLMCLLLLLLALSIHWLVTLQSIIPLIGCWYLVERSRQRYLRERRLAEDRLQNEVKVLGETLQKTQLIRGYSMENFEQTQFQKYLDRFHHLLSRMNLGEDWTQWTSKTSVLICLSLVVYLLGVKVLHTPDELPVSAALWLVATLGAMYMPLAKLAELPEEWEGASLALDRIQRFLQQIPEVGQAVGAKFLQPLTKFLHYENVSYVSRSSKAQLLHNFELRLPAEKVYAFVSLDPLQAQAAVDLLPRFIEPSTGRVLIDGEDIAWGTLESLRAEVVFVPGNRCCFTGTVLENISCGSNEYNKQQLMEAAKQSRANQFIMKLPQGYETVLGHHGEQLTAGQEYRISLARALVRNPALMIVQEPTVRLDENTKAMLDDVYQRLAQRRTIIFLPGRLSTIRWADQVVLIHEGKVEAIGTQTELLKTSTLYRHWEYEHFNQFR